MVGCKVCKICRGIFSNESDHFIELYRPKAITKRHMERAPEIELVGYFCVLCLPGSATADEKELVYLVPRLSNK